jgi:cation diffusion facilitator CzcD-associated flavoprotein CzcO
MRSICEVAIVGAGPYGLSLAAHLRAAGVEFRIFGKPLDTWRHHMPSYMLLKSDGFASSLSAPNGHGTLKTYCQARNIPYADQGLPVSLDLFTRYADTFQKRFVPEVEERMVRRLERDGDAFRLTIDDGETFLARQVVLAAGVSWFAHTPSLLAALSSDVLSHSFAHRDGESFRNRDVVVIGGGASAVDLAALLADCGASVRIVARRQAIRFHTRPDPADASLMRQLQRPTTGIGPGWRSFFCAYTPLLFHGLPEAMRLRITRRHLGPAPGWFMRERVEGKLPMMLGRELVGAAMKEGRAEIVTRDQNGAEERLACDHVIAATGYRPILSKLPFLSPELLKHIATVEGTAVLSDNFESSVPGLHVTGPAAANSFGPLMRFMVGAEFAAPRLAQHLKRRASRSAQREAA